LWSGYGDEKKSHSLCQKANAHHPILNLSLYFSILFTSSNLEEGIFGRTVKSNSVVTQKTVALTSICKTAPATGVEIMGVIEPTAFMSPVSEPRKRCQHAECGTLSNKKTQQLLYLIHIMYSTYCWINIITI